MKLSAYYKKKGEIVVPSPSFTPERHQQFFYRKDYDDGDYPLGLTRADNVQYGGLAFSNNVYQPLPLEIEKMKPDASIYGKMEKVIMGTTSPQRKKIFQNMMEAEHCRLSLDGKTIWPDYYKQFKFLPSARNLMLHDYDLGAIEGSFEEVQKILSKARTDGWATRVGMKFPIQIKDGESLLKWSSLKSNSVFYSLKYIGVIDDESFLEWVGKCREKAVYSQMEYHVTAPWYDPNDFVENLLPKILRQIIISRSYRVFFSLTYDDGYFPDPMWEKVVQLFNYYHNSYSGVPQSGYYKKIMNDTMFDFASSTQKVPHHYYGDVFTIDDIRKIFAFVRQKNYPLFQDFYERSEEHTLNSSHRL
jgi:hypothetical protein